LEHLLRRTKLSFPHIRTRSAPGCRLPL
jgi:hypothetical protein